MTDESLVGTQLPAGQYEVEKWHAHLWADAVRNDEEPFRYDEDAQAVGESGQLVPQSMCQHIAVQATGGVDKAMSYVSDDWMSDTALGGLRVDFHAPLEAGQTLQVEGEISNVVEKEGSSGQLTIVTYEYTIRTDEGEHVYDLEADVVGMGDE